MIQNRKCNYFLKYKYDVWLFNQNQVNLSLCFIVKWLDHSKKTKFLEPPSSPCFVLPFKWPQHILIYSTFLNILISCTCLIIDLRLQNKMNLFTICYVILKWYCLLSLLLNIVCLLNFIYINFVYSKLLSKHIWYQTNET